MLYVLSIYSYYKCAKSVPENQKINKHLLTNQNPELNSSLVTFAFPMLVRGIAKMSSAFAIKLSHERAVRVPDQQDGWVIHLDVTLAALMCLHADGASTFPVILLALEAWTGGRFEMWRQKDSKPIFEPRLNPNTHGLV